MDTRRDETLAFEAQQGNTDAFAVLVERHKGRVYRTLYQVVGDEQDAQDLAQEAFLKVYRSLAGYRGDAAFTTWLHRLTVNLALDWLRARKRRPLQVPLEPAPDREPGTAPHLVSHAEGPEEAALRDERRQQLRAAIRELPDDYREVVLLYHFHHLSYQQIAERLEAPLRTIETRLYRAKQLLKKRIDGYDGGDSGGVQSRATAPARVLGSGAHP
jgi:RNA polymerase sigma factor (sigma-70 family)